MEGSFKGGANIPSSLPKFYVVPLFILSVIDTTVLVSIEDYLLAYIVSKMIISKSFLAWSFGPFISKACFKSDLVT